MSVNAGDDTQDIDMNTSKMRSLVVLFNCYVDEAPLADRRTAMGKTVVEALTLVKTDWPAFLDEAVYVSSRELAVSLSAGHGKTFPNSCISY